MATTWSELEQDDIDRLTGPELLAGIRRHAAHLPWDLRESIDAQPAEVLRMLLLAGRLLHLLRNVWKTEGERCGVPSADGRDDTFKT